jgi:hypothetical protein
MEGKNRGLKSVLVKALEGLCLEVTMDPDIYARKYCLVLNLGPEPSL